MASPIEIVKPGELITSARFNHMAEHINDLMLRVAVIESLVQPGTHVTLKPFIGSVQIGDEITVEGTNFATPVHMNVVMFGAIPVTQFNPGTDDSHLVFNVPNIPGVPKDVTFSVTNSNGSASITITVLPATNVVPVGSMVITPVPTNHGTIQVGQTYNFPFILDSQTSIPETYTLAVLYNQVQGANPTEWSQRTVIRNQSNQAITSATIADGSPVTINVRVTIPPGATSANLTLLVLAVSAPNDPLLNVTRILPITVGQATLISDPRIQFEQLEVAPDHLVSDAALGTVIRSPVASQTLVRLSANFDMAGTYSFSGGIVPADTQRWTVALHPATPPSAEQGPGNPRNIILQLTALTADTLPSRILEIHAARTGPGETFDSWLSVAIQNG